MTDLTKYNSSIAWFTIAESVVLLTRETETDVATFRIIIKPIDTNNLGQGQKEAGFTFTDNIGVPYSIIDVDTNTIDVADEFRKGCPISGKIGIVHKSAYKGYSINLPTELLYRLHPIAASNNNKFAMSILWANDPNARRIAFTNVDQVSIADYRANLVDENGVAFNPYEDYGSDAKFEIWQKTSDTTYSKLQIEPEKTFSAVDGGLSSVLWSSTGETISGRIIISK